MASQIYGTPTTQTPKAIENNEAEVYYGTKPKSYPCLKIPIARIPMNIKTPSLLPAEQHSTAATADIPNLR